MTVLCQLALWVLASPPVKAIGTTTKNYSFLLVVIQMSKGHKMSYHVTLHINDLDDWLGISVATLRVEGVAAAQHTECVTTQSPVPKLVASPEFAAARLDYNNLLWRQWRRLVLFLCTYNCWPHSYTNLGSEGGHKQICPQSTAGKTTTGFFVPIACS